MIKPWGFHLVLNLYNCNPDFIRSAYKIKDFVVELCDKIKMKRHGDPLIVHFGENENVMGYSLCQLIETSSITGHFVEKTNNIYLDVFSCKKFDELAARKFCVKFFRANDFFENYLERY